MRFENYDRSIIFRLKAEILHMTFKINIKLPFKIDTFCLKLKKSEFVPIIHYVIFCQIDQLCLKSAECYDFLQLALTPPGCKSWQKSCSIFQPVSFDLFLIQSCCVDSGDLEYCVLVIWMTFKELFGLDNLWSLNDFIDWKRAAWTFYKTSYFVFYRRVIWIWVILGELFL